jgi:hypothetical protein
MSVKTLARRFDRGPKAAPATPLAPRSPSEWAQLRRHAIVRLEESLDQVPTVLRRLGLFLLVGTFAMVAFSIAVVVILVHAVA